MKRRWTTHSVVIGLLMAVPATGQETIRGFLETAAIDDCIPAQNNCERKPGIVRISGWAVADSGVRRVIVQVDGVDVAQADHGAFRPQVAQNNPGFPDSEAAGFGYNLNATDFLNGLHQITARVETHAGSSGILPAFDRGEIRLDGIKEVFWSYNTSILHPFGQINLPHRNAELFGTCCLRDFRTGECCPRNDDGGCCILGTEPDCCPRDRDGECCNPADPSCPTPVRFSPVTGWTLDLGVETGDTGIGWVELLVDGSIYGNTRRDCRFNPAAGGLSECYGLQRLDVEHRFPFALDAPNSGFRFALDVGDLVVNSDYAQGHHVLTIRSGDISNQNANVSEIPVTFFCLENLPNESAFGVIESPRPGRQFGGLMRFQGWALDGEGVDHVDVYVDGQFLGEALFGPGQGTRPAVVAEYPGFPDTAHPVWRLSGIDSNLFSDGLHQVQVIVTDDVGDTTLIGERTFSVDNGAE